MRRQTRKVAAAVGAGSASAADTKDQQKEIHDATFKQRSASSAVTGDKGGVSLGGEMMPTKAAAGVEGDQECWGDDVVMSTPSRSWGGGPPSNVDPSDSLQATPQAHIKQLVEGLESAALNAGTPIGAARPGE